MSLSTLRAPISRASLTSLTDDSLLVILGYLSVPQLLTFLSVSRRLNSLIIQYTLPHYRTIHLPNMPNITLTIAKFELLKASVFFSRRAYSHSSLYLRAATDIDRGWPYSPSHFLSVPLAKCQLSSFPPDLPRLLWRLQSLTFSYFLDDTCLLSDEEKLINRCLTIYLHSSWSQTLVSLKLYLVDLSTDSPSIGENRRLFAQLNAFPSLKHLFLHFIPNGTDLEMTHLPDSLPVLSQLHSFALHWYEGSNTLTLLHQLGPSLAYLSLCHSLFYFQHLLAFLCSRPSYRSTLTTLELHLGPIDGPQWSTLTGSFPALVHLYGPFWFTGDSLFSFFTCLGRLSQLRELLDFHLSLNNLRALRDAHPQPRLPTLPSIRRLGLHIESLGVERMDLQASELFDIHLPLLGGIFCAAEKVQIIFELPSSTTESVPLSRQLAEKVMEHFPSVRNCEAHSSYPSWYVWAN